MLTTHQQQQQQEKQEKLHTFSFQHPKIQIDSKEDVFFIKKEIESATSIAITNVLENVGMVGQLDLEEALQKNMAHVFIFFFLEKKQFFFKKNCFIQKVDGRFI